MSGRDFSQTNILHINYVREFYVFRSILELLVNIIERACMCPDLKHLCESQRVECDSRMAMFSAGQIFTMMFQMNACREESCRSCLYTRTIIPPQNDFEVNSSGPVFACAVDNR